MSSQHRRPVFIVSYPKSGNTWMRLALGALMNGGRLEDLSNPAVYGRSPWDVDLFTHVMGVRAEDLTESELGRFKPFYLSHLVSTEPGFDIIKLHDAARDPWSNDLFSHMQDAVVVHLVRDPRDVAPSWASHGAKTMELSIADMASRKHFLSLPHGEFSPSLPQYLGSWSSHVASWLEEGKSRPVLTIRYEDHLRDPEGVLRTVADHIGLSCDQAEIVAAVKATRFDRLAALEQRDDFAERPPMAKAFFRSGKAGGWQKVLTQEQVSGIEIAHGMMMQKLGYALSTEGAWR